MKLDILVPQAGESVQEAMIGEWLKDHGDVVEMDDPIVELETDKTNLEMTAEESGTLEILVPAGTTVKPGDVIGAIILGATGSETKSDTKEEKAPEKDASSAEIGNQTEKILSPAAQRIATEENLDVKSIDGTGKDGRVTKEDAMRAASGTPTPQKPAAPEKTLPASTIHNQASAPLGPQQMPIVGPMVIPEGDDIDVVPMSMMRRRIAQRLVEAAQTAAILTTFNEIDMTEVMQVRSRFKDAFQKKHGIKLGFMSFFVKACVEALKAYPEINARIEDTSMIYNRHCHVGVAVGTPKGLVVPVVRNADTLNFAQIEETIAGYAEKARVGKIGLDDLEGGTFTVSNGGIYGSLLSTPILNPPQSGILGMHKIEKRPVVVDDQIVIRPMMYVALSYDHRIVDGLGAVSFLIKVKECIEDPTRMLLEV